MTTNTPAVRNSGAGAIAKTAPDQLIATLNSMVGEIRKALPAHMSADRIARIMSTQIRTTPKLAQCSQGSSPPPRSVWSPASPGNATSFPTAGNASS